MSVKEILDDKDKLAKVAKAAFDAVDTDHNGFLDRKELEEVMASVANDMGIEKPSPSDIDDILKELDQNSDGKISLSEFQVLIKQILEIMANADQV
jgi:calmodulin